MYELSDLIDLRVLIVASPITSAIAWVMLVLSDPQLGNSSRPYDRRKGWY
ncbi:MAG: photosystem II protein Y [Cyanobacteria bacterium P01_H01_bin.15]